MCFLFFTLLLFSFGFYIIQDNTLHYLAKTSKTFKGNLSTDVWEQKQFRILHSNPNYITSIPNKKAFSFQIQKPFKIRNQPPFDKILYEINKAVIKIPRTKHITSIKTQNLMYMHFEYTVGNRNFIDDIEFIIDTNTNLIDYKSSSRVGYYDFGVNRKRILKIRQNLGEFIM